MRPAVLAMLTVACAACSDDGDALACEEGTQPLSSRIRRYGAMLGDYAGPVCVEGRADLPCAMAEADGEVAMCVPDGEYGLRMTQPGFESSVFLLGPEPLRTSHSLFVGDDRIGERYWPATGGTYPPTAEGNLLIYVTQEMGDRLVPHINAQIKLEPATAQRVWYLDDHGFPYDALTATTCVGTALVPSVAPGIYDLDVTSTTAPNCRATYGGYASSTGAARISVTAGVVNVMFVTCSP